MKSTLIALLILLLAKEAEAQSTKPIDPFKPAQVNDPPKPAPNLNIDDWSKTTGWPVTPKPGITLYFDYTKFFEWLLPKKHPIIPRDCDPNYFLRDSIPNTPMIKEDSVRKLQPPV